jgi:methionyl-tRNA formyltransferase
MAPESMGGGERVTLEDVCLVAANTARTKAYIQILSGGGIKLNKCCILSSEPENLFLEKERRPSLREGEGAPYFDKGEPLVVTLERNGTPFEMILSNNINDDAAVKRLRGVKEKYIIYSGFGGQLLKPRLFETGKKFLHVHAGRLPEYRGSTTIYYSLLMENRCWASAIFLTPEIDGGNVVAASSFPPPPPNVDIDYIYDPYIRAMVLKKALEEYVKNGEFVERRQEPEKGNTYYVIHPVLKHIALLKMESGGGRGASGES